MSNVQVGPAVWGLNYPSFLILQIKGHMHSALQYAIHGKTVSESLDAIEDVLGSCLRAPVLTKEKWK